MQSSVLDIRVRHGCRYDVVKYRKYTKIHKDIETYIARTGS